MKIGLVSIPSRNGGNHYINLFYKELEKYGFEILDQNGFRALDIIQNYKKINVFHFHFYPAPEGDILIGYLKTLYFFIKILLVKLIGIKIVWTAHNLLPHDIKHYRLQYIRRWVLVHMSDVIIVHFERAKDVLGSLFRVSRLKMICMHHGTYEECYSNSMNSSLARSNLGIPIDSTVFLYFGNIRRYKNIESLIKGFQVAAKDNASIILLLVGNPQDKDYSQELLSLINNHPQIRYFFKFIPDIEVQYYFNASNCCVLPYINIFTSGAALLALTFRKPIIMKRCEFTDEYFLAENGIFVENTDPQSIGKAIEGYCYKKEHFRVSDEIANQYKWKHILSKKFINELKEFLCKK